MDSCEGRDNLWPHSKQNLLPDGFAILQSGQATSNIFPHSLQNLALSRFSNPHFGHFILDAFQL
jgi:hypothetical protein